ncbi:MULTISPECIES: hypothetical protein [unclassified Thioalkalivibrio]|uniref:hypothetical protein n=1 Tax=unclassified Thioalkalivibrio TaxID=2621013 RepID=UPI0003644C18|nr:MULTISPECIES: hypothetical protein [unclassified Thioalkalivibrio]
MNLRTLMGTALALATTPVLAHPGHGHGDAFSLLHFLSSPEHLWPLGLLMLAIVGGLFGARWYRHRARR